MARFRSIDPDFWRQPQLAALPLFTRLLLIGLVSQADDEGRLTAHPMELQGILFPFGKRPTIHAITTAISQLYDAREIHLYVGTDRRDYLVLRGWKDARSWQYQVVQRRQAARCPDPAGGLPPDIQCDIPRRPPKDKKEPTKPSSKPRGKTRSSKAR